METTLTEQLVLMLSPSATVVSWTSPDWLLTIPQADKPYLRRSSTQEALRIQEC